ncbi:hypothetical protein FB451DRAFT_1174946 [Mycena latifolia]|nr:hypothetical protein FB451DRAFT_1174946 [Mycena latifolia]
MEPRAQRLRDFERLRDHGRDNMKPPETHRLLKSWQHAKVKTTCAPILRASGVASSASVDVAIERQWSPDRDGAANGAGAEASCVAMQRVRRVVVSPEWHGNTERTSMPVVLGLAALARICNEATASRLLFAQDSMVVEAHGEVGQETRRGDPKAVSAGFCGPTRAVYTRTFSLTSIFCGAIRPSDGLRTTNYQGLRVVSAVIWMQHRASSCRRRLSSAGFCAHVRPSIAPSAKESIVEAGTGAPCSVVQRTSCTFGVCALENMDAASGVELSARACPGKPAARGKYGGYGTSFHSKAAILRAMRTFLPDLKSCTCCSQNLGYTREDELEATNFLRNFLTQCPG